jgi:hypothetical protein
VKRFKPTEAAYFEDSAKVPMSKQQRHRIKNGDTDIRDTEHGDVWYTRAGMKYLMDKTGKIVTQYPVKGDARPTRVVGKTPPMTDYDVLKAAGHSPMKALEIISDANRGDIKAINWIIEARKAHG